MHHCGRVITSATFFALDTIDTMRLGCRLKLCYSIRKWCQMLASPIIRTASRAGTTADAPTVRPGGCHGYFL